MNLQHIGIWLLNSREFADVGATVVAGANFQAREESTPSRETRVIATVQLVRRNA